MTTVLTSSSDAAFDEQAPVGLNNFHRSVLLPGRLGTDEDGSEVGHENIELQNDDASEVIEEPHDDFYDIKWLLREEPRLRTVYSGGTWIDRDDSGDYNPDTEGMKLPTERRKRALPAGERNIDTAGQTKRTKFAPSLLAARQRGVSFVLSLKLASLAGIALMQSHSDNWPEDRWNIDAATSAEETTAEATHQLRSNSGRQLEDLTGEDDLTGHPVARGCKACYNIGQTCPLLEPDGTYPCYTCVEDDCDCEPVVQPKRKRVCEACKKNYVRCSYPDGGDHSLPCQPCQASGRKCVAGAAYDPTRTRLTADGKPGTVRPPLDDERQFIPCTPCRKMKVYCSLRNKNKPSDPPCLRCQDDKIGCTFEPLPKRNKTKSGASEPAEAYHSKGREFDLNDSYFPVGWTHGQKLVSEDEEFAGRIQYIETRLAHPITFNATTKPCHWCAHPVLYALKGLGPRTVKVIEWPDGKGYTELSGGHIQALKEPSRMCYECTLHRTVICSCANHELRPIPSAPTQWKACLERTRASVGHTARQSLLNFCSICPSLAVHECVTKPPLGLQAAYLKSRGCSLKLCDPCAYLLTASKMDLQQLVLDVKTINDLDRESAKKYWPHSLRPDYEFFKMDGLMTRQIMS